MIGKNIRLSRLFRRERVLIVPTDDALISGPINGLNTPGLKLEELVDGRVDAILGFRGMLFAHADKLVSTPFVLQLTASTILRDHTRKVLIGMVEEALIYGCDAVAVHVNVSSPYEGEMLSILGEIAGECQKTGMPLFALMYPRNEVHGIDDNYLELRREQPEQYTALVRHAVRIGAELGADIIKTHFTGTADSFATVVNCSMGVPILIAGGPRLSSHDALMMAYDAISAGAKGVCFGRQVYQRPDTGHFLQALSNVVHDMRHPEQEELYTDLVA